MVELQTILIIVILIGGVLWLKGNQPDMYNTIKNIAVDIFTALFDAVKGIFNNATAPEGTVGGCTSDADCVASFPDTPGITCNIGTGLCGS